MFKMAAELRVSGTVYTVDEIANLSVGGCQLNIGVEIPSGTECTLRIVLNPADRRLNVDVDGHIVRANDGMVGVQFTSIGPDALSHLQNIIRYNSPDPDKIESEIDERPGLV